MSSDNLDTESPMLSAFRRGLVEYQPVFRGEPLPLEHGDHLVSTANIKAIVARGLRVRDLIANGNGYSILVVFDTGEQYLATGFAYGSDADDAKVRALARLASKYLGGGDESWHDHLTFETADTDHYKEPLKLYYDKLDHDGDDGYEPDAWRNGEQLRVVTVDAD